MMFALSSLAPAAFAGKPEPLDKDFLDYLAACEGKDDNWTVIADDKQRRKAAEKAPPPATPADASASKPEVKP
jgi:hypothetical protein